MLALHIAPVGGRLVDAAAAERLNVLFIAVDDLRPTLGCYGDPTAVTPNIDRLAAAGITFNRAYCQEAVCNPSRASIITGRRPDTIKVWDLKAHFRDAVPDVVTLPEHFKHHGYLTWSIGKILHGSGRASEDRPSWTEPPLYAVVREPSLRYSTEHNLAGGGLKRDATESADVPDNSYTDGLVCDEAIKALASLRRQSKPFFLAVGFRKPHLPFCAPKKYWDLYDCEKVPPPATTSHPQDAPELAVRSWQELEPYRDIPQDGNLTTGQIARLRHGYYACVSFVDAQVGRLSDELRRLELADKTIVVLWGDHGYHLGEQGLWTKSNNYELSTRVPLILAVPGRKMLHPETDALVELVDVYPTLVDLCRLPKPPGLEGASLVTLLGDPPVTWNKAAFSQFPRAASGPRHSGQGDFMGRAVRTAHFRYVEWRRTEDDRLVARELYDHRVDPNETVNVVDRPEHAGAVARLERLLTGG